MLWCAFIIEDGNKITEIIPVQFQTTAFFSNNFIR